MVLLLANLFAQAKTSATTGTEDPKPNDKSATAINIDHKKTKAFIAEGDKYEISLGGGKDNRDSLTQARRQKCADSDAQERCSASPNDSKVTNLKGQVTEKLDTSSPSPVKPSTTPDAKK